MKKRESRKARDHKSHHTDPILMCVYAQKHRLLKSQQRTMRNSPQAETHTRLASLPISGSLIHSLLLHQICSDLSFIHVCWAKGDTAWMQKQPQRQGECVTGPKQDQKRAKDFTDGGHHRHRGIKVGIQEQEHLLLLSKHFMLSSSSVGVSHVSPAREASEGPLSHLPPKWALCHAPQVEVIQLRQDKYNLRGMRRRAQERNERKKRGSQL